MESVRALGLVASMGKGKPKLLGFHQVAGWYKGLLLIDGNSDGCSEVRGGGALLLQDIKALETGTPQL